MRNSGISNSLRSCAIEPLEARRLLAGEPWGAFPALIDQDVAVSSFSQYNGAGQTIAILDSGIDYTHPAIGTTGFGAGKKVIAGWDFIDNDADPRDPDGHGTAMGSLSAGGSWVYNGAKYQGIATGAKLVALRIDDGSPVPDSRIEAALQWVINNRTTYNITVINMSFGDGHYATEAQRLIYADELQTLHDSGVFIIASSGNDGVFLPYGVEYPAADPSVFAAGSINSADRIARHTERGALLDILAPGENVPIPYLDADNLHTVLTGTGTSFASPIVAGAAAILKQIDPNFTPKDIISILRASGIDNYDGDGEAGPTTGLIFPRLDIDNAIALGLARRSGQPSSVDIGASGRENGVKLDAYGVLHFAWFDEGAKNLKYATRGANGLWSAVSTLDGNIDVGHYVSLALTSSGKPAMAYYDARNADLKYAEFTGRNWSVQTVDARLSTGLYPSLGFDRFDDPLISYYFKNGGDLKFAINEGDGWRISFIDQSQDVGRYSSIAVSGNAQSGVSYLDTTTGGFKFASKSESASTWTVRDVDTSTQRGGGYTSLAYDANNLPSFTYYDAFNADLKFARFNGSSWVTDTVAANLSQGLYSNLSFDGGTGEADILYYHKSLDAVFRATGAINDWSVGELLAGGGRHLVVARNHVSRVFSYYHVDSNGLSIAEF
jgi:subtilisin family serine protease